MSISDIHAKLGNSVLLYFIVLAMWSLWRIFKKQGLDSNYWGALAIVEILVLAQGILGIYLWTLNVRPDRGVMHILYAIVSSLGIPGIFFFTKGKDGVHEMRLYAFLMIFLLGIVLRIMTTG